MGKSSGGDSKITVRYAGYIEDHHKAFLNIMTTRRDAALDDSPFEGYTDVEVEAAFFGTGYSIANFPSLYDMYGKFMAGLDVEALFGQSFEDTVNASQITDLVAAEADLLDDDIETNIIPRFTTGMRDINSVMSSSFITGKAMIEDARVKSISKFSAELKYRLIPVAVQRWQTHLEWNKTVILTYAEVMKLYYSAKMDITDFNYTMLAKNKLWPFTILDYDRAAIGALQGATNTKGLGASTAGKAISGALSGAAMGGMVGGAIANTAVGAAEGATFGLPGAIVGGVLGLAAGLFS